MSKEIKRFYEFEGVCLYPEKAQLMVREDGRQYSIRPKERDLLLALIKKQGGVVTYEELRQGLWPEFAEVKDILQTIRETKRTLSKLLKDIGKKPDNIIQTVMGEGYRLAVEVTEGWEGEEDLVEENTRDNSAFSSVNVSKYERSEDSQNASGPEIPTRRTENLSQYYPTHNEGIIGGVRGLFGSHLWHLIVSSILYALLYSIAIILEIAYQFERFGSTALVIASLAFCWIWITSLCGFSIDLRLTTAGKTTGFAVSLIIFVGAALLLYLCLGLFFPRVPITEAKFQTYPAHGAFFKNVYYFLPLAILFLIIPYHFVISAQKELKAGQKQKVRDVLIGKRMRVVPLGAIYLRLWWLGGLLLAAAIGGAIGIAHLFENLLPSVHMNLFVQLEQWRTFIFFSLGLECMFWYYRSLNDLKSACL
jgi:DNA-binding winged helix-turn-helix (wHTH) protein